MTATGFKKSGFFALLATQFQGAFNDNSYRTLLIFLIPTLVTPGAGWVTPAAFAVFNLPWLLVPALAGALADKYSKKSVTIATKFYELAVMATGVLAVWVESPWLLLFTLFMMAMQSAFFSPAKYGILPEILPESRLSWGNGLLQMWTFVAVILGTAVGGILLEAFAEKAHLGVLVLVGCSALGVFTSFFVTPCPPAVPARRIPLNPYKGLGRYFRLYYSDRELYLSLVGVTFFWFAGVLVIQTVTELGKATLADDFHKSLLLAALSLGIGGGSVAAGYLSRGKIELGLIPLGLGGMAAASLLLALPFWGFAGTCVLLFAIGFAGGLYDVPLAATIQQRSPDDAKGSMIAALNLINFSGMMLASLLFLLLFSVFHMPPQAIFLVTSILTVLAGAYMCWREPLFLLRMKLWLLDGTLLRLRVIGREHLPEKGPALLVGNHSNLPEALLLLASVDRHIHFVMGEDALAHPRTRRIARAMDIIPVPVEASSGQLDAVIAHVQGTLRAGHVVCVNSELRLAPEGPELPWHRDYSLLLGNTAAPLVPVHVSRFWQVLFLFREGRFEWRRPVRLRFPLHVQYGEAQSERKGVAIRETIVRLGMKSYSQRKLCFPLLHHMFFHMGRRNLRRLVWIDKTSGELGYFKALVGTVALATALKSRLNDNPNVGVLLPPSVGGVLVNVVLLLMGRVVVNLNYTASSAVLASCARQAGLDQVITSSRFLERLPMEVPGETILLEDVRKTIGGKERLRAILPALFFPLRLLEKRCGAPRRSSDDLATIIFSSGSEGEPKGVMLTHRNVIFNVETALEVFPHNRESCIVGFLPLFHSFGYMVTIWLPLYKGMRAVYHPNPLEPKVIGELTEQYRGTILLGTSTFMQHFIRRCEPQQLASLEFVVCGAEKLAPRVRIAFKEKFGIEPLEGYGTTELAPAASVNIPDERSPGFYYHGTKHGSVGRIFPGEGTRFIDPDSGNELPHGEPGLLLVKGDNVMQGYLKQPEKTAQVLRDGWYATGDIAALDDEGFISITDRLARFSKIAGEMVPHNRVEETLHDLLGVQEQVLAVAAVPDTQKGERLVVLHVLEDEQLKTLLSKLGESDLPNLWIPRVNAFYRIDEIPVLGTGKMDIKTVKRIASEREGAKTSET